MLFELVLMLVVLSLSFTLVASLRKNETLRKAIGNAIVHEAELDAEIDDLRKKLTDRIADGLSKQTWIDKLTTDRDEWQVEAAKRLATIERQGGDIVRLETSLKTAQRGNAVRASNR